MSRVILLRQFETNKGIRYQGDYCDISQWRSHMFVKPTGLALNKKDAEFFFFRYCRYFAQSIEILDMSRNLLLAFMYRHAAHYCNCPLNKVQQVILQFGDCLGDVVDVFCLVKK